MLEEGHGGIKRGMLRRSGQDGGKGSLLVILVLSVTCVLLMYNYWQATNQQSVARDELRLLSQKYQALQLQHREVNAKNEALTREIAEMKSTSETCSQKAAQLQKEVASLKSDYIPKKEAEDTKKADIDALTDDKNKEINSLQIQLRDSQAELTYIKDNATQCLSNLSEARSMVDDLKKAAERTPAPDTKAPVVQDPAPDTKAPVVQTPGNAGGSASAAAPKPNQAAAQAEPKNMSASSLSEMVSQSQSLNAPVNQKEDNVQSAASVAPVVDLPDSKSIVFVRSSTQSASAAARAVDDSLPPEGLAAPDAPDKDKKKEFADFDTAKELGSEKR